MYWICTSLHEDDCTHTPSPSVPSSLTYEHRWIGSRNPNWHTVTNSVKLSYLSVYDNRDDASEPTPSPSQPSSFKHVHSIQSHTLPTSTLLTFMCTQVLWCLERLVRISFSGVTMRPDTSLLLFLLTQHSVSETFRSLHFSVYALITPIYMYSL